MQTQPEVFFDLTATGWTAIGSMIGAVSIIVLSIFNLLTFRAAMRATRAAESQAHVAQTTLELLRNQLALTQRPFIAIRSEYCADIDAHLVYAHNQGNGPALDVEASLAYDEITGPTHNYSIGCMAVDGEFQFKIGDRSNKLSATTIRYKSISNEKWITKVLLPGGHPCMTTVTKGD
ncbi:MAG: hypothetical protein NVSMB62_15090 [Acidobacteriaceae bacterium]